MPECYQSIVIDSPIDTVWTTIRDFHDFSWGRGIIDVCEADGDIPGTEAGAKRILNGQIRETLLKCNYDLYQIEYSVDDCPSPVSPGEVKDYIATIQLKPVTLSGSTFVEWSSTWQARNEDVRDLYPTTRNFCHQIYADLLNALKRKLEQ
ncbi:MAG: SRPBCC family protein [Gammaproteobacteria bacterium]